MIELEAFGSWTLSPLIFILPLVSLFVLCKSANKKTNYYLVMNFTGLLGASRGSYFIILKLNFEHLTEFSLNEKFIASVVDANYGRFF